MTTLATVTFVARPFQGLVGLAIRLGRPVSVRDQSQHASVDDVPADRRGNLEAAAPAAGVAGEPAKPAEKH